MSHHFSNQNTPLSILMLFNPSSFSKSN